MAISFMIQGPHTMIELYILQIGEAFTEDLHRIANLITKIVSWNDNVNVSVILNKYANLEDY